MKIDNLKPENESLIVKVKGDEIYLMIFCVVVIFLAFTHLIFYYTNSILLSALFNLIIIYLLILIRLRKFYNLEFYADRIIVNWLFYKNKSEFYYNDLIKIKHQRLDFSQFGEDKRYFFYFNDKSFHVKENKHSKIGIETIQSFFKSKGMILKVKKGKLNDLIFYPSHLDETKSV